MDAINLVAGLGLLGIKAFALFLMVLGAIDLYTHIKDREGKE
jgi:hypothetical protein